MRFFIFLLFSFFITTVAQADSQKRIVSVSGANTEILYALGMGDKIVGTDTTSDYPKAAKNTPKIGYMRALSTEGVLSLKPDLIILTEEAGPPPVLHQLKEIGIKILELKAARSIKDIQRNIEIIADELDIKPKAQDVLSKIQIDMDLLKKAKQTSPLKPRIMIILQYGGGAPMVAGTNTAANAIISLSGGQNVVTQYEGYKPLTPEAALKMQPDYILVTQMGLELAGGLDAFMKIPGINLTKAGQEKRIIAMDAQYLLGFGPRTAEAALMLHRHYLNAQS